jgi:hypothetical protein
MDRRSLILAGLALGLAHLPRASAAEEELLAIAVVLELDPGLAERARAVNARIRARDARTVPLDATHVPHVALVRQFLRRADVDRVTQVLQKVRESSSLPMQLRLTGASVAPWNGSAMVCLDVERSAMLSALQEAVLAASIPFVAPRGDASAFVRDPPDAAIDVATLDDVSAFAVKNAAANYRPQVAAGVTSRPVAAAIVAERFEPVTGGVAQLALFQLGNDGAARRRLWP